MRKPLFAVSALVLTAIFLTTDREARAGGKSDDEVKITAKASKIDPAGKQSITLSLTIKEGWYIYANPVGNEDFENAATMVKIKGKNKLDDVKVTFPAGKEKVDKVGKEVIKLRIYEDKVNIQADVRRGTGDTGPLEVSIRIQACSKKGVCLQPAVVKLKVD